MDWITGILITVTTSIALIILFYILWINGLLIVSRKTAVLFAGFYKFSRRCQIKFKSCNGYIKRVIKIRENRNHTFTLHSNITKGNVTAEILDKSKKMLLKLDKSNPESVIELDKENRYYLVIRFEKADGEIDLTWN